VRVSTELQAQEGVSLDAQRDRIRAYCKGNGIELVAILTDDTSGETMERPGLQKALAMLDSEAANSFVVVKLDRLTRSLLDLGG
jgi:DNA invertase Pin-like site-specific DNA recombinase